MKTNYILCALVTFVLVGCGNISSNTENEMVGTEKDRHGCVQSAGYSWCQYTNRCERPWELAKQVGFANTIEKFETYCMKPKD